MMLHVLSLPSASSPRTIGPSRLMESMPPSIDCEVVLSHGHEVGLEVDERREPSGAADAFIAPVVERFETRAPRPHGRHIELNVLMVSLRSSVRCPSSSLIWAFAVEERHLVQTSYWIQTHAAGWTPSGASGSSGKSASLGLMNAVMVFSLEALVSVTTAVLSLLE